MGDGGTGGGGGRLGSAGGLIAGLLVLASVLAAGCSSRPKPVQPAAAPPAYHTVRKGDTLYGISFRYNLDYRTVARWNGIGPPYRIYPGQRIRLHPPQGGAAKKRAAAATQAAAKKKSARAKAKERPASTATRGAEKSTGTPRAEGGGRAAGLSWTWPTEGRLVRRFRPGAPGRKGIDIAGRPGQPVRAAAAGEVVYAGSGLRGYGALIIIKHNKTYLSAYAHNRRLLVKEGDRVRKGQKIAELGSTGTDSPKLHFEIRRNGKPVDPLRYLPRR